MILMFPVDVITRENRPSRQFTPAARQIDRESRTVSDLEFSVTVGSVDVNRVIRRLSRITGTQGHSSETFILHLVSPDTGKPTIAAVADSLLRKAANGLRRNAVPVAADAELFKISVSDLQDILEGMGR